MSYIILNSGKYDLKKWYCGQWVCVLMFGDNWMQHPLYQKYNDYEGTFPVELIKFKNKVEKELKIGN